MKIIRPKQKPARANAYVIDELFPIHEIHLIAGASGSGKTTWLAQTIEKWQNGEPIFGFASYPKPFIYLSLDRSVDGCERAFDRVGVDYGKWKVMVPEGAERKMRLIDVLRQLCDKHPDTRVFFIEGFASQVRDGKVSDYKIVAEFLTELQEFCVTKDITIIGVAHTAKTKEGEGYTDLRQKVLGSVAWAGYSEGIVFIQQTKAKDPESPFRDITLLPRNAAPKVIQMQFQEGKLVETPESVADNNFTKFAKFVDLYAPGEYFTLSQALASTGIPESSLHYELNKFIKTKKVVKMDKGTYAKVNDVFDCGSVSKR